MRKQERIFIITALCMAVITGCSKNDGVLDQTSLKQAIDQSALKLNTTVKAISATKAYSILTMNGGTTKSANVTDSIYKVYIPLDKINGVYEYNKVTKLNNWGISLIHFFTRTADNKKMIVNLPLSKVTKPWTLRHFSASDSSLTNNFSIAVSAYHNNYNSYWDYDYNLVSEISIDKVVAGNLNIETLISPKLGKNYASQYTFSGGYSAKYKYVSGDSTVSTFTILSDNKIVYEEKLLRTRNDTAKFHHDHQYILTIGNVQITRKSDFKDVTVAVNGVLQPNAKVAIVDNENDEEASVCKKRDVQITFEDGTVTTISALIGSSVDNIKTLYTSLHQVYFAAYIVDWIAYDIYYQR